MAGIRASQERRQQLTAAVAMVCLVIVTGLCFLEARDKPLLQAPPHHLFGIACFAVIHILCFVDNVRCEDRAEKEVRESFQRIQRQRLELLRRARRPRPVARKDSAQRCPYCREAVGRAAVGCEDCGTLMHSDCVLELGGCTTLGCSRVPVPRISEAA